MQTTKDDLPLIYKDMTNKEDDVQCIISPDLGPTGDDPHSKSGYKYVAIFINKTKQEQKTAQLDDLEHVSRFRAGLCLEGWRLYKKPMLDIKQQIEPKNRKQRRALERREREAAKIRDFASKV